MADVKHCTASPINDFEGFLHIFYCRIKNFTESLTEKLLRQVGWQGRVQNNRNSPHDVQSLDCRVLTQAYSQNFFSSRFWRIGEQWFLSLLISCKIGVNRVHMLQFDGKLIQIIKEYIYWLWLQWLQFHHRTHLISVFKSLNLHFCYTDS